MKQCMMKVAIEAVAKHLNTEHITLKVEPNDALNLIDKMPRVYSEPFADSSQIPTTLLSSLVRTCDCCSFRRWW